MSRRYGTVYSRERPIRRLVWNGTSTSYRRPVAYQHVRMSHLVFTRGLNWVVPHPSVRVGGSTMITAAPMVARPAGVASTTAESRPLFFLLGNGLSVLSQKPAPFCSSVSGSWRAARTASPVMAVHATDYTAHTVLDESARRAHLDTLRWRPPQTSSQARFALGDVPTTDGRPLLNQLVPRRRRSDRFMRPRPQRQHRGMDRRAPA